MILVDTSIWIAALRGADCAVELALQIKQGQALLHPWVESELRMGSLPGRRQEFLRALRLLDRVAAIPMPELHEFIEKYKLFASGLSLVDAGLLASARGFGLQFWTNDKLLQNYGQKLNLKFR